MRQSRISRRERRSYINIACGVAVGGFVIGALGMGVLVQSAIMVAQGYDMHIGADVLLQGLSSDQLAMAGVYSGLLGLASMIAGLILSVKAGD